MRKILATIIAVTSLGYSSAFAGTLVINTDLTDPAPKAAFEWAFNKFQEENPDVTIEVNNFDHEGYKQAIRNFLTTNPPDVFNWYAGNRMLPFVRAGLVEDVSDIWSTRPALTKGNILLPAYQLNTSGGFVVKKFLIACL